MENCLKVEVKVEEDEEPEEEIPLLFYTPTEQVSAVDPLAEPIPQPEPEPPPPPIDPDPEEELTVIPACSSQYFSSSSTSIHPFSLKIPRMKVIPSEFSLNWVESSIRTFINNSMGSRKDPRSRHQFYLTINTYINELLYLGHISSSEVDPLWQKFDQWASSTCSYRLGDHYMLQYRNRANDPDQEPPPPKRCSRNKKSSMIRNLENSVRDFVLNSRGLPLCDDLRSRVHFYQSWHKYWNPGSELFLDHFWNALLNRTPGYYTAPSRRAALSTLAMPPAPRKIKEPPPLLPLPPPVKRSPVPTSSSPKNLDMDRLVKLCINSLVSRGKDPRASHRFYWTVHRSLETVSSLNMSVTQIDELWTKYDTWADQCFQSRQPFEVVPAQDLYSDVIELPPPIKKMARKPPAELELDYPRNLINLLESTLKTLIVGGRVIKNELRSNLRIRRLFLESYVHWVEPHWKEPLIDGYWARLLRDHVGSYYNDRAASSSSSVTQLSKKLDMDRLIKYNINILVGQHKDPRASHRFYWTVHRALEAVSSLQLSKKELDELWTKYDDWANKAWVEQKKLTGNWENNREYYLDVAELPLKPKAPKPKFLCRGNGLRKLLENNVRTSVIQRNERVNTFRKDLVARRSFFESYVEYVSDKELDCVYVIDGYWGRLVTETIENYKTYLELGKVVEKQLEKEKEATTPSTTKAFNMDYLVKRQINECLDQGKDPRTCHNYYWTMYRCVEEAKVRGNLTQSQMDAIWAQYDSLAGRAWQTKTKYGLMPLGSNFLSDLSQLAELAPLNVGGPSVTQLYPSCPKSTALKRFLEGKVKQLGAGMGDWRTRRTFFLAYFPHVQGMPDLAKMMEPYWNKLFNSIGAMSNGQVENREKEVPCYVID